MPDKLHPHLMICRVFTFLCLPRFHTLAFAFYFVNVFMDTSFIENSIQNFERHFWNHRNELIGSDFIGQWMCAEQRCTHYVGLR